MFRTLTTSAAKARSDIPAQTDITEGSGYIDCVNISLTRVKNVIGGSTFSVYDLCRHDNVNVWSQFGPTLRSYTGSGTFSTAVLVNSKPTTCKLGDFAGYDHVPVAVPGYETDPDPTVVYVNTGSYATLTVDINIGEFDYPDAGTNPGLLFIVFDAFGTIKGWELYDLDTFGHNANLELTTIDIITSNKTGWYAGVYITNDNTITNSEDLEETVLCIVPNSPVFDVSIYAMAASNAYYADTLTNEPPEPWDNTNGPMGMNWTTGYVTIGYFIYNMDDFTDLHIYAELRNYAGTLIGSADIWDGPYNTLDEVYGTWYLGMTDIPAYGYTVRIYIEESA